MRRKNVHRGFTLAEVLVTIAILATLVAVLLPALFGQLSKGDATRTSNDLIALQTGVSTFASDVKRYPARVSQLTTVLTISDADINAVSYPGGLTGRWKGPYLTRAPLGSSPGDSLQTGFGGAIRGAFLKKDYNGIPYVTIQIANLTAEAFDDVDLIIDETASSSTGRLVMSGTVATGTALYYAVPIQ